MKDIMQILDNLEASKQEQKVYVELLKLYHIGKIQSFTNNTIYNILKKIGLSDKVASTSRCRVSNSLLFSNKIEKIGKWDGYWHFKIVNEEDFSLDIKNPTPSGFKRLLKRLNKIEEKYILNPKGDYLDVLKVINSSKIKLSKRTKDEINLEMEEIFQRKLEKINIKFKNQTMSLIHFVSFIEKNLKQMKY